MVTMNEEVDLKVTEDRAVWSCVDNVNLSPVPSQHAMIMPTTPQGAPTNPGGFPEYDLPFDLTQQGWRKFWSKRENRPYFWNKLTGESLWEMPLLKPQFDPITDPLGICAPGPPTAVPVPNGPMPVTKRRISEELGGPQAKKFVLAGPWDLDVPTNVIILERSPCSYMHSHPEIEAYRCSLLSKLRQCYQELCHSRESIDAPKDSFNRWLMERKVADTGIKPYFFCSKSNVSVIFLS